MRIDTSAAVARAAVSKLGAGTLDPAEFLHEVSVRVRRVVPHEASGWMTLDPDTTLPGGALETEKSPELVRALWRNELLTPDVNKLIDLTKRPSPLAALSQLDEETAAGSRRIELIYRSIGIGDELRVMLRAGRTTWGHFVLYRAFDSPDFSVDERAFVAQIAPEIADGLRRSMFAREAPSADPLLPGVVTVDAQGAITSATGEASRIMGTMPGDVPSTMYAVAVSAHRDGSARSRVRLAGGRWLLLHGERVQGDAAHSGQVAVMLLPAPPDEVRSILLRLHGLTPRERQVAELLILGVGTDDIAARLHISLHTLRDHVKSIFAKVGVSRRSELMTLPAA